MMIITISLRFHVLKPREVWAAKSYFNKFRCHFLTHSFKPPFYYICFFFLDTYLLHLPYIIMGTLGFVAAFAALFLPESFGRPLPETIQQMHKRERWAATSVMELYSLSFNRRLMCLTHFIFYIVV